MCTRMVPSVPCKDFRPFVLPALASATSVVLKDLPKQCKIFPFSLILRLNLDPPILHLPPHFPSSFTTQPLLSRCLLSKSPFPLLPFFCEHNSSTFNPHHKNMLVKVIMTSAFPTPKVYSQPSVPWYPGSSQHSGEAPLKVFDLHSGSGTYSSCTFFLLHRWLFLRLCCGSSSFS